MQAVEESLLVEETGVGLFQVRVDTGETIFMADEPTEVGGLSSGPDPFKLVGAALGACTVMTMRLFARRKGWDVPTLGARVRHIQASPCSRDRFDLTIHLDPDLPPDHQARLLDVASRCPVHRMLERGAEVGTNVERSALAPPAAEPLHGRIISSLCKSAEAEGR